MPSNWIGSVLAKTKARLWTNLSLRAKGLIVVSLPVAALVLSVASITQVQKQKDEAEELVKHTQDVRTEILNSYIVLIAAESDVRNYALTGHEEGLRTFDTAGASLDVVLERINHLVQDNPEQIKRVDHLKVLIHQQLDALKSVRAFYDSPSARGAEAPQALLRQCSVAMSASLRELTTLFTVESRILQDRSKRSKDRQATLSAVIYASLGVGLLGGIASILLFTTGIVRRVQRVEAIGHQLEQGLLLESHSEANDELGRLAGALQRTGTILAAQAEELKLALEYGHVLVWELDPATGRIRYQAGSEALKSARFPELRPETVGDWVAGMHPDDRDYVRTELKSIFARNGSFEMEYRAVLRGGDIRWMAVTGQHHSSVDGRPQRLLGVKMDITQRKKSTEEIEHQARELAVSREALHQQTRILQSMLDSMGDGVVVANRDGKFLVFNPAAKEILGTNVFATDANQRPAQYGLFLPDMVTLYPADRLPLVRAIRGESVDAVEMFIHPAGMPEGKWVSVTARPLKEDDGGIGGGVVVIRDITAARRAGEALGLAKQEADRANQAKSEFLSRMSHELRTPLNSILGFAQLLELEELTGQQADNVEHILKGGHHLLDLINEVLDLARIEAGRLALSSEPVQVKDALREALDLVRPLAAQQNISLCPDLAVKCDRHVMADRQRLKQVLLNLLSNAIKFNRNGGSVALSCAETSLNKLRIEITDSGCGISPEGLKRIFKPFERLGADLAEVSGTGLGLALSRRLVESMGGTIGVESAVGLGSKFFIDLELVEDPSSWIEENLDLALALGESRPESKQGTVLYIEDNLSNLRLMEQILERCPGVRLLTAMQGHLGLDLAYTHNPDWILLDLHLPDLPGEEVLRRLLADPRTKHIPVTVVSADATPGQISRLIAGGANDYLTKPIDVRKLLRLLEETMQQGESLGAETPFSYATRDRPE